ASRIRSRARAHRLRRSAFFRDGTTFSSAGAARKGPGSGSRWLARTGTSPICPAPLPRTCPVRGPRRSASWGNPAFRRRRGGIGPTCVRRRPRCWRRTRRMRWRPGCSRGRRWATIARCRAPRWTARCSSPRAAPGRCDTLQLLLDLSRRGGSLSDQRAYAEGLVGCPDGVASAAQAARSRGDLARAEELLKTAAALRPAQPSRLEQLADLQSARKETRAAEASLRAASALVPRSP